MPVPNKAEIIPPINPNKINPVLSENFKSMILSNTFRVARLFSLHNAIPKLNHRETKNNFAIMGETNGTISYVPKTNPKMPPSVTNFI